MWNKRKEEENLPKQAPVPQPANYGTTAPTIPSTAAPSYHMPETSRGMAVIGKSVTIKGQIFSQEDLTIDGEMEGSVELKEHRLTVGPNGKIQAGIKAREIVVLGTVNGNVEASDKIDIRKEARLVGDIKTSRIVIEDGAYFKGSIDITRAGTAEPPPKPAAAPSQPRQQQQPQQQSIAAQNAGK
jgi:cytoskeletal protein CcmA (bactofilin family)